MSEALSNRLDKIENEIKLLMMLQKKCDKTPSSKYHQDCVPGEQQKAQRGRPKSAVDMIRKLAMQKKRKMVTNKRRSASSTGISRHSSSSPPITRSPTPSRSPRHKGSPPRKRKSSQKGRSRSASRELDKSKARSKSKVRGKSARRKSQQLNRSASRESEMKEKMFTKQGSINDDPETCVSCCKGRDIDDICCQVTEIKGGIMKQTDTEKMKSLEDEVRILKELVTDLNSTRNTALSVCQQWRDKYNDLKSHQCCCKQTYKEYKADKAHLEAALEAERVKLSRTLDDLQNSEKQLNGYEKTCKKYEELLCATKSKNMRMDSVDEENRALQKQCDCYKHELDMMKEKYDQLQITNQTFAKDVLNRCKCYEASTAKAEMNLQKLKTENERLQATVTEMCEMRKCAEMKIKQEYETVDSLQSEIGSLRNAVDSLQSQDCAKGREICELRRTIAESTKVCQESDLEVSRLRNEVCRLSQQNESYEREITCLQDTISASNGTQGRSDGTQLDGNHVSCNCSAGFEEERTQMLERMTSLQNNSMNVERCITEKCQNLECKLEQTTQLLNETEVRLTAENKELRNLAEHLTEVILKQKNRMQEMSDFSDKHKEIVDAQSKELQCKCYQLQSVQGELEMFREKYEESERTVCELSTAMQSDEVANNMEREIEALNKLLEDETHKIHIKEKIIEDQCNTICQLKKKLCETDDKVAMLYKELNLQKNDKNELNVKLSQLSEDKKCLSEDCKRSHMELERTHGIITNLERKMVLQNREWELQMEMQVREKEKAIVAAQFASEKLMETIHDFQKQTECQNQVRNMLATMLQDKDDKLRSAILEISSLTYDPETGACGAQGCGLVKGRNETSDSNDSFTSCRASFRPETNSTSVHPSANRCNASVWHQVYPPSRTEAETTASSAVTPACMCRDSYAELNQASFLKCRCGEEEISTQRLY